jgi:hypothetical protein
MSRSDRMDEDGSRFGRVSKVKLECRVVPSGAVGLCREAAVQNSLGSLVGERCPEGGTDVGRADGIAASRQSPILKRSDEVAIR